MIWIDATCGKNYHDFEKVDGKWVASHADDTICEDIEFSFQGCDEENQK